MLLAFLLLLYGLAPDRDIYVIILVLLFPRPKPFVGATELVAFRTCSPEMLRRLRLAWAAAYVTNLNISRKYVTACIKSQLAFASQVAVLPQSYLSGFFKRLVVRLGPGGALVHWLA